MTLDLEILDVDIFVLFLQFRLQSLDNLISNIIDVRSSLGCTDTVDETDLERTE
jgi:hypothetical protein